MLQREIVRFRASDTQPNPLEVDYWIDVTSNYYGGCIRYYRNDTNTWEMLNTNDKQADAIIDYINKALDAVEQFINETVTELRQEMSEFKDDVKEETNKLWQYINQNIETFNSQIQNIRNNTTKLKQYVNTQIQNAKNYTDSKIADVTSLISQETTNRTNAINALRTELKKYVDDLINDAGTNLSALQSTVNSHIANKSNPHTVTRAQLSLATTDSVVFNKVSAPSGFFKE